MCATYVRFTPKSRHSVALSSRPLCPKSYQRHICFGRAPIGTVFRGAAVGNSPASRDPADSVGRNPAPRALLSV
jgi:hypothetical protein